LSNSPWTRGAPQSGFSTFIERISLLGGRVLLGVRG
jgi:hypothetical protein